MELHQKIYKMIYNQCLDELKTLNRIELNQREYDDHVSYLIRRGIKTTDDVADLKEMGCSPSAKIIFETIESLKQTIRAFDDYFLFGDSKSEAEALRLCLSNKNVSKRAPKR